MILAAIFVYLKIRFVPIDYVNITPTTVLLETNPDFATAQSYLNKGDYISAKQYYEKALATAQDTTQELQIQFYIASVEEFANDYTDAIVLFKQIAANSGNWKNVKAYAIQELANIHYHNVTNQAITAEIFSDEPYSSFYLSTSSPEIAYRKLLEYVTTVYPLGFSEAYTAYWNTRDLENGLYGATTTPQAVALVSEINRELVFADADVSSLKDNSISDQTVLQILSREGIVLGHLALLGVVSPERAENIFKENIQLASVIGNPPGSAVEFYYASFLANLYGKVRIPDINQLLSAYIVGNSKNVDSSMRGIFIDARTDPNQQTTRSTLIKLGQLDSSFETYLISLGWQATDFL